MVQIDYKYKIMYIKYEQLLADIWPQSYVNIFFIINFTKEQYLENDLTT